MSLKPGRPVRARRLALLSTSMAVTAALILPAQHASASPTTASPSVDTAHGNGNAYGNGNGNGNGSGKHVSPQSIFDLTGLTTLAPNQKPTSSDTATTTTNSKASSTAPTKAKSTAKASDKSKVAARSGAPAKTTKRTVKKPLPPKAQGVIRSAAQAPAVVLGVPGLSAPAYTGSTAPVALPSAVTVRALPQPQPLPTLTAPSSGNPAINALRRIEQLTAESLGGDGLSAALVAAFMAVFGIGLALGATRRAATR